jgi:rhodanese-related sulfurtransferase
VGVLKEDGKDRTSYSMAPCGGRRILAAGGLAQDIARPETNPMRKEDGMATTVKQMLEAANSVVPRITPAQAQKMIAEGNTLVVDVRDTPEVEQSGKVAGAVHVSRGMLEFRADPESPSHNKEFAKDKNVVLYCASGGRAALSGKLLKDMGYEHVYNLGAFKDWAESGGAID